MKKKTLLLIVWYLGVGTICIFYSLTNPINIFHFDILPDTFSDSKSNQDYVEAVSYSKYKPNLKPEFHVSFDSMSKDPLDLGFFKINVAKSLLINNLFVKLYNYSNSTDNLSVSQINSSAYFNTNSTSNISNKLEKIKEYLALKMGAIYNSAKGVYEFKVDKFKISLDSINFLNISESQINNFECQFYEDENLVLGVKSHQGSIYYDEEYMTLRGHCIITSNEGNYLKANHIKWHWRENYFEVVGGGILNKSNEVKPVRNICFDMNLNTLKQVYMNNIVKK